MTRPSADLGHPLRLGIRLPAGLPIDAAVDAARLADDHGLEVVVVADGAGRDATGPATAGTGPDAWTLLGWLAGTTRRVRLATDGLDLSMRPPAVAARAAASLDLLTRGRVELGVTDQSPAAAEEAVRLVRAVWDATTPGPIALDGAHHRVAGAERGPAPAHPLPVWIGGVGTPWLELAGRAADGWWGELAHLDATARRRIRTVIDAAAGRAGRDPGEIRRALTLPGDVLAAPPAAQVRRLVPLVVEEGFATLVLDVTAEVIEADGVRRWATRIASTLRQAVADARATHGVRPRRPGVATSRPSRRAGIDYDGVPAALADTAVEPDDPGYADVRATYVRGGSPGLVLRPRTAADVADAVTYARRQAVPLAVRSGGHGISGRSTNDGGLVLDLGAMDRVEVLDAATRRVRIEPGARWGDVARVLRPYGWAISSGDFGGVGVGGLATTGGIGYLARGHGLTIDHLVAAEIVVADGTVHRTDAHTEPELFWGIRGAGSALGIVTAFEFEAAVVGDVGFAQLTFDASDTAELLQAYGEAVEQAPRDLGAFLLLGPPRRGQPAMGQVMAMVDAADPDVIVERLQPLARIAPLVDHRVTVGPYHAALLTPPRGPHHGAGEPAARSGSLRHLTAEVARDAATFLASGATSFLQFRSVGGAVADVPWDATAYADRDATFSVVAFGADAGRIDRAWAPLAGHFTGMYWSFSTDRRPERLADAFPPATLARLRALKGRYDPAGVFGDNLVVPPIDAADTDAARAS